MSKNQEKLEQLSEICGYPDEIEMLNDAAYGDVVPGICFNDDCDYMTDVEPDQDRGYCEACGTRSVKSCLILADMI